MSDGGAFDWEGVAALQRARSGASGGASVEAMERSGRRLSLLNSVAPSLTEASPGTALEMAEGSLSDDEMVRAALETTRFVDHQRLREDLEEASGTEQRAVWANLPKPAQDAMRSAGYEPPEEGGGGRLFGSVPILGDVTEAVLDWGEVPGVGGALEEVQHFAGEGLEPVGQGVSAVGEPVLGALDWLGQQPQHFLRAQAHAREEGGGSLAGGLWNASPLLAALSPSFRRSWGETYEDDGWVRPEARARAESILGDSDAAELARLVATGKSEQEIVDRAGYEPGSPEAAQVATQLATLATDPNFQEAVKVLGNGQFSFGRFAAQDLFGVDDTNSGFGRILSGTIDAGVNIGLDPLIVIGAPLKAARFGRFAFRLEDGADVARGFKYVDLAIAEHGGRMGLDASTFLRRRAPNFTSVDARRGRQVLAWADRVSRGFRDENGLAALMRDLPDTSVAMTALRDAHVTRRAAGLPGLDTTTGVLEWLRSRDGLIALAGSRLGGGQSTVRGLRIPALTTAQRATLRTKAVWQKAIDASRIEYAPAFREIAAELGNPRELTNQIGRWLSGTFRGSAGRTLAALGAHTPYKDHLALYGPDAVPEFTRLVNAGIFAGIDRPTMDATIDAFARGDFVTRANLVDGYLETLFTRTGIADTEFAQRFLGRHRQAYGIGGSDVVEIGGRPTHVGRLVDAHHADAMAIPSVREFLQETKHVNLVRHIMHGTPASWVDAKVGRYWKPSVLMRVGFIPRAAGEELLHHLLKFGPRSYLGAKGAEWQVAEEVAADLRVKLREAEAFGQVDEVNRLTQQLARYESSGMAPFRSLLAAMDRGFTTALAAKADGGLSFRERLWLKQHQLDEKGVVSGMEMLANHLALRSAGFMEWAAERSHLPSRAEVGRFMAERWNPEAAWAARQLLEDPVAQRAFVEEISGARMGPKEFDAPRGADADPIRNMRVRIKDTSGARPVVREVSMRPVPGSFKEFERVGPAAEPAFWASVFARAHGLKDDRIGHAVLTDALPRFTGGGVADLPKKLGAKDHASLRAALNDLYAKEGTAAAEGAKAVPSGREVLRALREFVDDPDVFDDGRRGWLSWAIGRHSVGVDGRQMVKALADPGTSQAARHWALYEHVDPARLTGNWADLERGMGHTAVGRASRPDMASALRESRLYHAGERLAVPTQDRMSKVYVPLTDAPAQQLGEDFVEVATDKIVRIGGYGVQRAETVARRVAEASTLDRTNVNLGVLRPISGWGAADPRVADAVLDAVEQVTGVRGRFGIIEVPDEAVTAAASSRPLGLRAGVADWREADGWDIEHWQLARVQPTSHTRRLGRLEVDGRYWDESDLDEARRRFRSQRPGTTRMFSTDRRTWSTTAPDGEAFTFVDLPGDVADRYGAGLPDEVVAKHGARRLPAGAHQPGWQPVVTDRQAAAGLPEVAAIDRVASSTVDEVLELLTTRKNPDLDDDVLHEIVEPLLRGESRYVDEAGNDVFEPGLDYRHLWGADVRRLPTRTYGPELIAARELKWDRFVRTWFDGPVREAISAVVRKPLFLENFGESFAVQRGLADLWVPDDLLIAARAIAGDDVLDTLAMSVRHTDDMAELVSDALGRQATGDEVATLTEFAQAKATGMDHVRHNALNRAMQLTTPYIDDHAVRSAFQEYVGNFVPFLFAEEQFLKRWARSVAESPEMIRKMQLGMNGLRSMGVVREDAQGRQVFSYPLVGMAAETIGGLAAPVFGDSFRVPFAVEMTGDVGYVLPGLGHQFGVPSGGPLVSISVEFLSRHFPELADVEQIVNARGADRNLWEYVVPSWAGNTYRAVLGDMDTEQVASATLQAMQTRAINGDLPAEGASPEEMQEWIDDTVNTARTILLTRSLFGMVGPAAPQVSLEGGRLNDEFQEILQSGVPIEEAFTLFAARHPDMEPADLVAATVSTSEQEYGGLGKPTDAAFEWMDSNSDLIEAFPAAASWLIPQGGKRDAFSYRAWSEQLARGLRKRKAPQEFLNDIYFQRGARDYFDSRLLHEAAQEQLGPVQARQEAAEWAAWKDAYFVQHPVFAAMLRDPTRQLARQRVLDEMQMLAGDETAPMAGPMRELVRRFDDYRLNTAGLRGDRRGFVVRARRDATTEFYTWAQWHLQAHPELIAFFVRVIEPELTDLDEDAVTPVAA